MLREILDLEQRPTFRTARMIGYKLRLWGQYPALVHEPGEVVHGLAFDKATELDAQKLAAYETNNYQSTPCNIEALDSNGQETTLEGYVFKYCGDPLELSDGSFDLDVWLAQMRRK